MLLVGAGPGDPDLLTVRAARAIAQADVILADALLDPRVLALAKPGARILDVGKTPRGPSVPQEQTCARLFAEAHAGHTVVRLKSGDPFVFGRGAEEAQYLAERGIAVDVVPGLSSALAVPALARIPLTHRGWATSFTVLTGTKAPSTDEDLEAQWSAAAKTGGTLVFLMAMHALDRVQMRLLESGLGASTPCAVIQNGAHEDERVLVSELGRIVDDVRAHRLGAPAIVVVGSVVALRDAAQARVTSEGVEHVRV